ncbi:related to ser/thr protein kinases [Sporisorium reilianum SRZ2]|uniref:non-specific serine/threonine protein kinase n=1 Tax=Sporisorium reilianum (strain SRZ2) TaxID=999809 RepID=E6ZQJ9_SPORE|nr:related to ser/thr protein kinases [Sporisorium reilianum SRZ2]
MSQPGTRRAYGHHGGQSSGSTINQKAALASAYQELGKELASSKLKIVGNYTLQRPIGEGTFGKVRLGLHRLTNTRVAIKQIPKAHSASLTREIHHHRRLHHPNVMQLYEVIATEQYIWMVSEICAGGELYDYLVENQVLAEPEARRIFGQLCLAVAYVHSKGIVHRDLKLENILLDERCNVKLGDFGFTREFERNRLMDTFCGTTGYASPEMLAGKRYTGEEVDIWSLGVILYALLCGALPFDDDDEAVMKQKILQGDFEIPDCLSEEAQNLIASILQQDPTKRPSIQAILSHPWFSKMMVHTPMSTVEEDENATDYFDSKPLAQTSPTYPAELPQLATEKLQSNNDTAERPYAAAGAAEADPPLDSVANALHLHQSSASATSEQSYHSARSDSESSDRRSTNTDFTDPTTADSLSRTDEVAGAGFDDTIDSVTSSSQLPASAASVAASHPSKQTIGLHRNESQTTIRRLGSNGSDASLTGISRPPTKSTSTSLPTHHELPAGIDAKADDIHVPLYQSVPLTKRGSQGSSRGHHRTPSRTKRRSLSSGGLSDHHPLLGRKPVDYVSQLADLQPATFSTSVEQNLLHQLSTLGMDVGQMVHSVVTDACDASGAVWWMLLRKAKERQKEQPAINSPINEAAPLTTAAPSVPSDTDLSAAPVPVDTQPPPVPFKDPARWSEDKSRSRERSNSLLTASRSDNSGLAESSNRRLQTVVSHEELNVSSTPSLQASASEIMKDTSSHANRPSPIPSSSSMPLERVAVSTPPPANDRSLSSTPDSTSTRPKSQHRHTTAVASPSKLQQVAASLVGSSPTSEGQKTRRSSQIDRPRSNSLSVKQFAQSVLGTKDKGSGTPPPVLPPDEVIVAGEVLPLERSKSPTLFGRRNTVSNVKESMVGRLSNPSTPKKNAIETLDKPRKSTSKKSSETDLDRVKALERSADSGSNSPSRSGTNLLPGSASTTDSAPDKLDGAVPSASQDSFSTMSATPQGSEKSGARGKAGSSLLATVRTWLGGNEKPARKSKAGKKSSAAYRGLGIDDGSMTTKSPTSTLGTSGSISSLANGTPSRSASMRRRSAQFHQNAVSRRGGPRSPHLGSVSRRPSNGSSYQAHLDLPPNSFQQSMSRPGHMRRMSAGSITPTATLYGDYVSDMGAAAAAVSSRHSRPSSSHSLAHSNAAPRSGLHGKAGSTGSTSSVYRGGQAGSTYSTGSGRRHPRPSPDGGTMVRRHRAYASSSGSPSRHGSFRHESRPSSIKSRASSPGRAAMTGLSEFGADAEGEGDAGGSGARRSTRSTPRQSLELRSLSEHRRPNDAAEAVISPQSHHDYHNRSHHQVVAQSIFVAHKSRSPYRPPSANPNLHGSLARGASQLSGRGSLSGASETSTHVAPSSLTGLPATGTGTWRHSWGRPPPCWAGPVDPPPPPSTDAALRSGGDGADGVEGRPKLRDVFANREDDDWTDEEEEPTYSGGLGQMGSLSSMSSNVSRGGGGGVASSSPYATRNFAALGGTFSSQGSTSYDSASNALRGAAPFSSRYAGVRSIFQQPASASGAPGFGSRSHQPVSLSLGNEFAPKLLSTTLHSPTKATAGASGSLAEGSGAATAGHAGAVESGAGQAASAQQQGQQQAGGSRITASFHKPAQIIEEEEEDE